MLNRLFSITFESQQAKANRELFYRVNSGTANLEKGNLKFSKNTKVSFDTFFNCFSFSKYKKHTVIQRCELKLGLKGEFIVNVYKRIVINEYKSSTKDEQEFNQQPLNPQDYVSDTLIYSNKVSSDKQQTFSFDLDFKDIDGEGLLFFELTCLSENGYFFGGEYLAQTPRQNFPKIAIGICTFRREKFVIGNLNRIEEFLKLKQEYSDCFKVFVIDNGSTLNLEEYSSVELVKNKNLGGSGGFTRAIIEIDKAKEYTHFLLMDDDIVFSTGILEKLYGLLAYAKDVDSLAVGGGMMMLGTANRQYEFGALWGGDKLYPFNRNYNLSDATYVALNEKKIVPDYNAWWFMCMPTKTVQNGLPLPLFIKGDDIEYGLRWKGDILLINGISVWHEDFDLKYSGELEYYIKRNEMIVNALHRKKLGGNFHARKLVRAVASQVISQRYEVVDIVFKAYKDFLKGPEFLLNVDGEKLHQELRELAPKQYNAEQLKAMGYDVNREYFSRKKKKSPLLKLLTLNGYLIPYCFYNKTEKKEGRLVRLGRTKMDNFYKSKVTIQYNRLVDKGMVTKQSRLKLFKVSFKLLGMYFKTLFGYRKASKLYQKHYEELTSINTWNRLLNLDK